MYVALAWLEAEASNEAITGTITLCQQSTSKLFDPGLTFSYVSIYFASCLGISLEPPSCHILVLLPMGDSLVVDLVCQSCSILFRVLVLK